MQQTRVRAVAASVGRGLAGVEGDAKSRFPSGMTTRKARARARAKAKAKAKARAKARARAKAKAKAKEEADSLRE